MEELDRPIGQVRLRLAIQRFLVALEWCLTLALAIAACLIGVEKLRLVHLPGPAWAPIAVAAAGAVMVALGVAWFRAPRRLDVAVLIDQRCGLQERLSTALSLTPEAQTTAAGRAVISDAIAHIQNLDYKARFGLARPRRAWMPLVPAALALGLAFLPERLIAGPGGGLSQPSRTEQDRQRVLQQALKAVSQNLAQKKPPTERSAGEPGKVLAELQKALDDLAKAPPRDAQQALIALNKLADTVQERRKQLGTSEQMDRQLQQLKELAGGPAGDLSRDLARGDFQKAVQDLKTLQEKLASGAMTEPEKQELARQLDQLKKELEKLAGLEDRRKQLEEARKNGMISQQQYEQQKEKLEAQSKQMQSLQNLAKTLGETQQALKSGDSGKASKSLQAAEQQMEQMAEQASELESLDSAMADIQDVKESLTGDGMNQLGDNRDEMAMLGQGMGMNPGDGNGSGLGRGQGDRAETPNRTASYDSKVKQQLTKGKAVLSGFADPQKQVRGESLLEGQEAVEAAASAAADALTDQRIPRSLKKHVQSYFDQVRKGE